MKKQTNPIINAYLIRGAFYLLLLIAVSAIPFALAFFAPTPAAQGAPPPKPEDRGNFNSAAENVSALNPNTTGTQNEAHGWYSLFSDAAAHTTRLTDSKHCIATPPVGTIPQPVITRSLATSAAHSTPLMATMRFIIIPAPAAAVT